ncbi:hypothetical protein [Saccharothrix sp. NRRL B-16348]|uniref:hypothetical protein n=1 Tax=Saccharothrix sp. NRRL B-16348 TaxID=1415542 RepID=UPI0012FAE1DC|nr:hypothetical protein [Saccharothrix sp. NRRL B-16348]
MTFVRRSAVRLLAVCRVALVVVTFVLAVLVAVALSASGTAGEPADDAESS